MKGRTAALAILISASAAAGQDAPEPVASMVRPWDAVPLAENADRPAWSIEGPGLDDSLDLRPEVRPGPRRLRLVRRNETVVENGRIDSRLVAEAVLRRAPEPDAGDRSRAEVVEWESYRFGFAQGGAPLEPADFPGASEISFRYVPGETDLLASPVDVSSAADGVAGVLLQAMVLDATTWDALLDDLVEQIGPRVAVGAVARLPEWEEARPLPGPEGEPAGSYRLGPTRVEVAGLTRVDGEPCALLWFRIEGSEVDQSFDLGTVSIHLDGGEWFRGTMAVSLIDGRVVRGELGGSVVALVETSFGGGAPTARSNTVLQSVALWEVDEADSP